MIIPNYCWAKINLNYQGKEVTDENEEVFPGLSLWSEGLHSD